MILALVSGCTGTANYWVPYAPMRGTTTRTRPAVIQRATIAITDAGYSVESSDATAGILLSKWFHGDGFMQGENRYRLRIILDEANGYEIEAMCQTTAGSTGPFDDHKDFTNCGDTAGEMPRFVVDAVAKVDVALR